MVQIARRRGRPRKAGPRFSCGRRRPNQERPRDAGIWYRLREVGERFGLDPRHASEISRLAWLGQLTDRQAEAAHRIAAAYASLQRLKGWPSPNPGGAGIWRQVKVDLDQDTSPPDPYDRGDPEQRDAAVRRAEKRWFRIQAAIDVLPSTTAVRRVRALIERLCVLGESLTSPEIADVASMLDYIAEVLHIPGPPAAKPTGQSNPAARRRPSQPRPRRHDIAETAFRDTIRQLRPDLQEAEITAKWLEHQARIDRERLERGKGRARQ